MATFIGKYGSWNIMEDPFAPVVTIGHPPDTLGCDGCKSITEHLTKRRSHYTPAYTDFWLNPADVKKLMLETLAGYGPAVQPMTIGTGPWMDSDDTGDPPSTKPMGYVGLDLGNGPPLKKSCGASCKKCKTFNEYAESNQKDGSYVCFECR